jgi:SagB-type dehydrogenase family enzyme
MFESAWEYHSVTSYRPSDMGGGRLDWGNQPTVFKTYPGLQTVSLPEVSFWPDGSLSTVLEEIPESEDKFEIDLERLSRILLLTHSLTAKTRYAGEDFYYRSVASAGALYPFELYVAAINVPGLDTGLYHQNVRDRELTLLRFGDVTSELSAAVPLEPGKRPVVVFFLSSIFFRSSWKYRDRGYRYNLLDTGHLAENLCLALNAEHIPFRLTHDFDDQRINDLLRVDPTREGCLAVGLVESENASEEAGARPCRDVSEELAGQSWVSTREVNYEVIRDIHRLSCQVTEASEGTLEMRNSLGLNFSQGQKIKDPKEEPELMSLAEAVFKRRSMRNFVNAQLPSDKLAGLLRVLCMNPSLQGAFPFPGQDAISIGLLAGNVEGLEPGFYILDTRGGSLEPVTQGLMTREMARVCLGQAWLANCALHFLFLTNLRTLESAAGPRGYRHAMLAAGRLGQRIYLAATSMHLGCCGIGAFYDLEASAVLGLNDESALLYLVAAGPVRRWTQT